MIKKIKLLLIFSSIQAQTSDWFDKRPIDNKSFIGISGIQIKPGELEFDYQSKADDEAILEISKQIQSVAIGESRSVFTQRGLDADDFFSEKNVVYTVSNIKGLIKVDSKLIDRNKDGIADEYWSTGISKRHF